MPDMKYLILPPVGRTASLIRDGKSGACTGSQKLAPILSSHKEEPDIHSGLRPRSVNLRYPFINIFFKAHPSQTP